MRLREQSGYQYGYRRINDCLESAKFMLLVAPMSCLEAAAERGLDWAMWAKSGVIMVLEVCQAV